MGLKSFFSFPCIDHLIKNVSGQQLLSFMDASSGYNQILMAEEDEEKTASDTKFGKYH